MGVLYKARHDCLCSKSREEEERCTNQTMALDALLQNRHGSHDRQNERSPAMVLVFLILWRVEQMLVTVSRLSQEQIND